MRTVTDKEVTLARSFSAFVNAYCVQVVKRAYHHAMVAALEYFAPQILFRQRMIPKRTKALTPDTLFELEEIKK
jgi:hypothetical protein